MNKLIESYPGVDDLRAEQLERWERGDHVRLEALLAAHTDLADSDEAILDLVYAEVLVREEHGESPEPEEYLRLFPHLAAPLRRLFSVHEAVASLETDDSSCPDDGTSTPFDEKPRTSGAAPLTQINGTLGAYRILEEIGRGGMGIVFKAHHTVTGRLAALKVMRTDNATEQERARFLIEAKAVSALSHPNIVQIYEVVAPAGDEGTPYVALEYVAGGNLTAHINGTPLPPREAATLLLPLAEAMSHAHQAGIVHRDLKPANVLLSGIGEGKKENKQTDAATLSKQPGVSSDSRVPKITDFGLAKELEANSGQTRTGAILGTPCYMAPEQATGQTDRIGPGVDVYALGAILYEMLSGRPPFKGATVLDTLDQVRCKEPVTPRELNPAVPRDLETICLKCLQKEPEKRFASCRDLADDLRRYLGGEPIQARAVGPIERSLKWMKRRPAAAALLAVTGLAFASLVLVWVSFTVRLDEQRLQAVKERDRATEQAQIARRQSEEAARQTERAGRLLALTAAAVDEIAISARSARVNEARIVTAGTVLFRLASFYAKASGTLTTDQVLPEQDRQRLAEQYAVSSMRLLNCAQSAGFFDEARAESRAALDNDPNLAVLHDRAEYKRFRERLH